MTPFLGVSAYAAAAWDEQTKRAFFNCYPKGLKHPAAALLWGTFGNCIPFAKRFINWAGEKPHLLEICVSNECSRRTGRDGKQICRRLGLSAYEKKLREEDHKTLGQIRKRVKTILEALTPALSTHTRLALSVGLEDNLSNEAASLLVLTVMEAAPGITVIRNPMARQEETSLEWIEGHGRDYHEQEVWNWDGVHIGAIDSNAIEDCGYGNALNAIKAANKQYKALFLWSATAQGWKNQASQPYAGRTYFISPEEQEGFRSILKQAQA